MSLTDLERAALRRAEAKGGAQIVRKRTADRGQVTNATANRLVGRDLAARHEDETLHITHRGVKALHEALPPKPATFLKVRDGLTTRRDLAVRDEPEVQDTGDLHPGWSTGSEQGRRLARLDHSETRLSGLTEPDELRELLRIASERGKEPKARRYVRHAIRALRRELIEGDEAA